VVVFGTLFSNRLESLLSHSGPAGVYLCGSASCMLVRARYDSRAGCRVRTGTEASLTVLARPWQNQTAGRGRGPTGGSSDACEHPRRGRSPLRCDVDTGNGHPAQLPFLRFRACRPGPRGQRRHLLRVHGLRPQLELTHGCTQAEVRLVRERHPDRP
jgi:hypothetical protein